MTILLARTAACAVIAAVTTSVPASFGQATSTQWSSIPALCKTLQREGWVPQDPLGREGQPTAEAPIGGSLQIFLCRVTRPMVRAKPPRPARVRVFMQYRGGHVVSVAGAFWTAEHQEKTLSETAAVLSRVAKDVRFTLPAEMLDAIRAGKAWEDISEELEFRVRVESREGELITQPGLKPADVPLLSVEGEVSQKIPARFDP